MREVITTSLGNKYPRNFIPAGFDPAVREDVEKALKNLTEKSIHLKSDIVPFIEHWSELYSIIHEAVSSAYVDMTCDTKNAEYEKKYLHLIENIIPVAEEYAQKLKQKLLASDGVALLPKDYYGIFLKSIKTETEIFREENLPLFVEDSRLSQKYQKISGAWMVEFEGKKYTMQQMAMFQESSDRITRKKAWLAKSEVSFADADRLDNLYDEMLVTRNRIAKNAGFKSYRDFMFKEKLRFDYTPDDCFSFHDAIEETIVPLLSDWMKEKAAKLGVETIRPWDIYADENGHGEIRAFENDAELIEKLQKVFHKVHNGAGNYFDYMVQNKLLDLPSREGKAPGGYMTELAERRVPFIFMNAVGTRRDVDTLLHEMGHAIHAFQARDHIVSSYRSSPLEFAEVASMSMELLGRKYFNHIYTPEQIEIVKTDQLKKIIEFFPFMAMIDAFQHWVYTTDNPDTIARGDKWLELAHRFQPYIDYSGLENYNRVRWQYPHVFTVPFYYIEYGIAQVGALQVWKNSLQNEKTAIQDYLHALALGGSKSLPELFTAAGIRFAMDKNTLQELVDLVRAETVKTGSK